MAPDFEKKREPLRFVGNAGQIGNRMTTDVKHGMILLRCHNNPLTDYYRHHGK